MRANGCYHSFSLGDSLHIDLLQFADDTMLSVQPSRENLGSLKALLHGFELCLGLSVNFNKSRIIGVNVDSIFF